MKQQLIFSFRSKLILLMIFLVIFVSIPLIIMSSYAAKNSINETYRVMAQDILTLAENSIVVNFNEMIMLKSLTVQGQKEYLEQSTEMVGDIVQGLCQKGFSISEIVGLLPHESVDKELFLISVQDLAEKKFNFHGKTNYDSDFWKNVLHDFKGRSLDNILVDILQDTVSEFIVFQKEIDFNHNAHETILTYLLPLPAQKIILASVASLKPLQKFMADKDKMLRQAMQDEFNSLGISNNGIVAAFQTETLQMVVHPKQDLATNAPELILQAILDQQDHVIMETEYGPMLCYFKKLPLYHTVVFVALPQAEIFKSLAKLNIQQGIFFVIVLGTTIILALFLGSSMLKPLTKISQMVTQMSTHNFSNPINRLTDVILLKRKDELGELARTFARLGYNLHHNIVKLLRTTATKERLESELNVARQIQEGLLPQTFPQHPEFTLFASLNAAKEIGGDLYDFFRLDDEHLAIAVGDVSGKGIPAALFMSVTMTVIRSCMKPSVLPHEAMAQINEVITKNNPHNMFITLFLGVYNVKTGELNFALGGHPPGILLTKNKCRVLDNWSPDLVLGSLPDIEYELQTIILGHEESLLLYTDGLTEILDQNGEFYGEERLVEFLNTVQHNSPQVILQAALAQALQFAKPKEQPDDLTMLLLKRN